jgi:AcrR family transcriptional regulator
MRALAKAARTTTPTLYERFQDRNDLLYALRARAQQSLFDAIKPSRSIAEACRLALDFTVAHGHDYELVAKDWAARLSRNEPTPSWISSSFALPLGQRHSAPNCGCYQRGLHCRHQFSNRIG